MTWKRIENCKTCNVKLNTTNSVFSGPFKRMAYCHPCYKLRKKKYWIENAREKNYKARYKLTLEEYNKLLELQLNGCAICKQLCKSGQLLCVDHNHKTGEVRGLLCKACNNALGLLNDDEDLFWNAIEYLKRTTWEKESENNYADDSSVVTAS